MEAHSIVLSEEDAAILTNLLEGLERSGCPDRLQIRQLEQTLEKAEILEAKVVPPELVNIHCAVRLVDLETGKKKRYTIVLPELADMAKRLLSVVAPLALALLGHRQGEVVEALVPSGVRQLRIERVRHLHKVSNDGAASLLRSPASRVSLEPI